MDRTHVILREFNATDFQRLIDKGTILERKHPKLPFWIYNYSKQCQIDQAWNSITLECRGLILDKDKHIIARPFAKFFNYEEKPCKNLRELNKPPDATFEKVDGSLGILYYPLKITGPESGLIASRGSFDSLQAIEGTKMFQALPDQDKLILYELSKTGTCLFEIIYPENEIVVKYNGLRALKLLGWRSFDGKTMKKPSREEIPGLTGVLYPSEYKFYSFGHMLREPLENAEGYVAWFGQQLTKIKFEDYKNKHRMVTQYSPEYLINELYKDINWEPDEELANYDRAKLDLDMIHEDLEIGVQLAHDTVFNWRNSGKRDQDHKKSFARYIKDLKVHPAVKSAMFMFWDDWETKPFDSVRRYLLDSPIRRAVKNRMYHRWNAK